MPAETSGTFNTPTADASHSREYRHSGFAAEMETIILSIPEHVRLLDDKVSGAKIVKERLDEYYRKVRRPATGDPVLFLPKEFSVVEILKTAQELLEGKASATYTDAGKFLQSHTGILILHVSDVYYYRPEKSWAAQCWIMDTDHFDNSSLDYFIRNELIDDNHTSATDSDFEIPLYKKEVELICDENGDAWDDESDAPVYHGKPGEVVKVDYY